MNTETTDNRKIDGSVLFDADCRFCCAVANCCGPLLRRRHLELVPLQTPWVRERLGLNDAELLTEMRFLTPEGAVYGGADALLAIARRIWWANPACWFARLPGVTPALRIAYAWFARHRHCLGGTCSLAAAPRRNDAGWLKWLPAVTLPVLAGALGRALPGWALMWLLAMAMFIGAKWLTVAQTLFCGKEVNKARWVVYLLLWPGMDAPAFFKVVPVPRPPVREWTLALAKALFGASLLWIGVPLAWATRPILSGWFGMLGIVLLLHFGLFHILSLIWRSHGIDARPIMDSPGAATSLARFWSKGWNTAFADLMRDHCYKGLARRLGPRLAMAVVFLLSGLLHDFVISFPARGGYGLPTLYFAVQGLGVLVERSRVGRRIGVGSGWRGSCFVALVAGGPVFVLFHPIFIRQVILPMLQAIGAS